MVGSCEPQGTADRRVPMKTPAARMAKGTFNLMGVARRSTWWPDVAIPVRSDRVRRPESHARTSRVLLVDSHTGSRIVRLMTTVELVLRRRKLWAAARSGTSARGKRGYFRVFPIHTLLIGLTSELEQDCDG